MRGRWCLLLLALTLRLSAGTPPDAEQIEGLVQQLGAEAHPDRQQAFETLMTYSGRFPRFMLLELSDRYRSAGDLEVRFRLEALLTPLAGRYLFAFSPGFIGINMEWWFEGQDNAGIRVLSVLPGHAGERAGLRQGDILLRVEDDSVSELGSLDAFSDRVAGIPPGSVVRFDVLRNGAPLTLHIVLDRRPDHLDIPRRDWREQVEHWIRSLAGQEEVDPLFPIGHFPRDPE